LWAGTALVAREGRLLKREEHMPIAVHEPVAHNVPDRPRSVVSTTRSPRLNRVRVRVMVRVKVRVRGQGQG
jgi:hypothetical protein